MKSPNLHTPLAADDADEAAAGADFEPGEMQGAIVYPPPEGGGEVVPSGSFSRPAAPRMGPPSAPRPVRPGMPHPDTEIISALRSAPGGRMPRRGSKRNRKAPSAAKLLGAFVACQVVIGLLAFAIFGGMIRSWMVVDVDREQADGVTAEEAAKLRGHVEEATAGFERFGKDLAQLKKQIAVSPGDAWAQLGILGKRNELTMLADDAIANGTRASYDKLVAAANDVSSERGLRDGAAAEILRVRDFYASGTRPGTYALPVASLYPSLVSKTEEALTTSQLLGLLADQRRAWQVRLRAAYLLASRRDLLVSEALVNAAKSDPNLDVVEECIYTFEEITGYRSKGMFEVEALEIWWDTYQERARVSLATETADPS